MQISVLFLQISLLLLAHSPHPSSHRLACPALKGITEGVVASVATLHSQLLDGEGTLGSDSLVIKADEMINSQIVDISIIIQALTGEILTEIVAVGANFHRKPGKRDVILQI